MESKLHQLIEKHGTDKNLSEYTQYYDRYFPKLSNPVKNVLEIGIGTLEGHIPSTFVGIKQLFPEYRPGGSLRVWRDLFPDANVYGIDIAADCMFTEERIKTFLFDSSNTDACDHYLSDLTFDLIIDDGNHDPKYQIQTLENLLPRLNKGGLYVIEDVGGYGGTETLWETYREQYDKLVGNLEKYEHGNIYFIFNKESSPTSVNDTKEQSTPNEIIIDVLNYIGKNIPDATAIQIGAMDGETFDDTHWFFDTYNWKSIFVEPIPSLFEELKQNLNHRKKAIFENVAIGSENKTVKMITIPYETIQKHDLPLGYKGMSAIYPIKNGFSSDSEQDINTRNKYSIDIDVPCITFDELVTRNNFEDVDILICDAEGYDWDIFKAIDLNKYKLSFIRLEWINLTEEEKEQVKSKLTNAGYIYKLGISDIDAVRKDMYDKIKKIMGYPDTVVTSSNSKLSSNIPNSEYTIVSGLWDISREGRDFDTHYLPRFKEFLQIKAPMILFLPEYLHKYVWEVEERNHSNTYIKTFELEDVKTLYGDFWEPTQKLRTSKDWLNITGEGGWLKTSPQATLEYYNPIVQSKMFMLHDASIYNNFQTDYYYWLDAGITNTVPAGHLIHDNALDNIVKHTDPFLFLSYPYESAGEIHGFKQTMMDKLAREKVNYVCRGGLFGGHKEQIRQANAMYYSLLNDSLSKGVMGTEESIFTIMSYLEPYNYTRFALDGNGLIVKFTEALINDKVKLEEIKKPKPKHITNSILDISRLKTNLYILTFNFPDQLLHTLETMKKLPEWLTKPRLILLDNSTNDEARDRYKEIAAEYNFEYISLGENKGICGGRQFAAEHFHNSDADYYFFFEDDMTSNPPELEGKFCRNGFRKFIPNLYDTLHYIMEKEEFDYLKLSFTEVYWDNNIQTSWYNVPQAVRTEFWPDYDKLPVTGRDPNAPRTEFGKIDSLRGLAYITGDITYTNWPMIMSRKGNEKVFIETKWDHPYEQTWMSYVFQKQKKGEINAAVLLASPIWHDRIKHYKPEERREN